MGGRTAFREWGGRARFGPGGAVLPRGFSAPDYYVDGNFPPCFVVASAYDLLRSESECLRDELEKAGVKNGFYMCKGVNGVHAGSLACDRFKHGRECLRLAKEFVASVLADEPSNAAQPD